jgi:NADH-quinone oxidoreductase subunit E
LVKVDLDKVKEIVEKVKQETLEEGDILINTLHAIQDYYNNFVPPEAAEEVAKLLNIPVSRVYEVLSFYSMFSIKPRGKYVIRVCKSLPCHVTGGREVMEALKNKLGIEIGETTTDGMFTLETTSCLGLCGVAPVIMINDQSFGNLTPEKIDEIIERFRGDENA